MTVVAEIKDLKITFNGSQTYFVSYHLGNETMCLLATNTERKARNFFNKTAKASGYVK